MSLLRNSWLNLIGLAVPSLVAIPAMGFMARTLDRETFGLFSLALAFLGYSAIFDGGLSRAVIREVSRHRENPGETRLILGSAVRVSLTIGIIVTFLMLMSSDSLTRMLNVTAASFEDARTGVEILAYCIPLVILNATFMALLEGREEFVKVNIIRASGFSLVFLVPVLLTAHDKTFKTIAFSLVFARLIMLFLTYSFYLRSARLHPTAFSKETLIRLYRFGGWLTISNIISPVMEYVDRFVLANIRGSATVIYYTAPAEITTRLLSLPGAISRSLFPAVSSRMQHEVKALVLRALVYQLTLVSCTTALVMIFAGEILHLWLGEDFATNSKNVLLWLMVGFFFNGLATIPFTHLQASGKARVTAIIHLAEVGPYLLLLGMLTSNFGLTGAAVAWSVRVCVDFLLMSFFSWKTLHQHTNHASHTLFP
jgi:O-antigen/teichoic acid export membrane protein